MQPWQHLAGLLLSGQSTDNSVGHVVRQSHFALSGGHVKIGSLLIALDNSFLLLLPWVTPLSLQVIFLTKIVTFVLCAACYILLAQKRDNRRGRCPTYSNNT